MEKKLAEIAKENNEETKEYFDFIKASVADGSYFRDAWDWYFFRYVSPICDRTLLMFGAIIAAVVLYFLIQMVQSAFPLVERDPIFIRSTDQSLYFPHLVELRPKPNKANYDPKVVSVDDAVLKYLLSLYVKKREGYDFSNAEVYDVNKKFNYIRNNSSPEEYEAFQILMSKSNPDSPINNFGKNIKKTVEIQSVDLIKSNPIDFKSKAINFLTVQIPTAAQIKFTVITTTWDDADKKEEKQDYVAKISFYFSGVRKDNGELRFMINKYELFKVK